MSETRHTEVTVVFQRRTGRDESNDGVDYLGYDILWPDGQPVRLGLRRFCQIGSRILVGRGFDGDRAMVRISIYHVAGREAPLTRPGRGIRCRRLYALHGPDSIRFHFLDGTPTEVVFDPHADERRVLSWIQAEHMRPGEPYWFDLASQTVEEPCPAVPAEAVVGQVCNLPA
jgi:hypothetical protein